MQIRFNLSSLEQWCREQQIPKWNEVVEKLEPIIQATKLLQTRKTEEHIQTIVEMCNKLRYEFIKSIAKNNLKIFLFIILLVLHK